MFLHVKSDLIEVTFGEYYLLSLLLITSVKDVFVKKNKLFWIYNAAVWKNLSFWNIFLLESNIEFGELID